MNVCIVYIATMHCAIALELMGVNALTEFSPNIMISAKPNIAAMYA